MFERSPAKRRPPRRLASAAASTKREPSWFKAATPGLERRSWRGVFPSASSAEQVPRKLLDFRNRNAPRLFDFARFPVARTTPSERLARQRPGRLAEGRRARIEPAFAGSSPDRRRPLAPIGGTVRPPARSRRLAGGRRISRPRRFAGGLARRSGGTDLAFERWRKVGASRKILTRGLGVGENRGDPTCAMGRSPSPIYRTLGSCVGASWVMPTRAMGRYRKRQHPTCAEEGRHRASTASALAPPGEAGAAAGSWSPAASWRPAALAPSRTKWARMRAARAVRARGQSSFRAADGPRSRQGSPSKLPGRSSRVEALGMRPTSIGVANMPHR